MKISSLLSTFCLAALPLLLSAPAIAGNSAINTSNASGWVLENYGNGGPVVIWYSGAVCENGSQNISLPNPNAGEINRLWTTIMSAKVSGASIFVWYDNKTCSIVSFGFR
jgi:hypothetical protein